MLLPDDHDAQHDRDSESGGCVQRVEERTVCEPPLFSGVGEVGAGETNRRVFVGVNPVSASHSHHSVLLETTLCPGTEQCTLAIYVETDPPSFSRFYSTAEVCLPIISVQRQCRCKLKPSSLGRKRIDNNVMRTADSIFTKLVEVGASTYAKDVSSGSSVNGSVCLLLPRKAYFPQ